MGNQKWTPEEESALRDGLVKHGRGKWSKILNDPEFSFVLKSRTNVDLKDKARNMDILIQPTLELSDSPLDGYDTESIAPIPTVDVAQLKNKISHETGAQALAKAKAATDKVTRKAKKLNMSHAREEDPDEVKRAREAKAPRLDN